MAPGLSPAARAEPKLAVALDLCVQSLRTLANYELDHSLQRRLRDLGERKEDLDASQHDELISLMAFAEKRTAEKLLAQVALKQLREVLPELVDTL